MEPLGAKAVAKEILRSKSGLVGISIIVLLLALSLAAVLYTPFDVAKAWNDPTFWIESPRLAAPEWSELLSGKKQPRTMAIDKFLKSDYYVETAGLKYAKMEASFPYHYDDFPSDLSLFLDLNYGEKRPLVTVTFVRPDGDALTLIRATADSPNLNLYISNDLNVMEALKDYVRSVGGDAKFVRPQQVLFAEKSPDMWRPDRARVLKGSYTLKVEVVGYRPEDSVDGKFIVYGTVHGLAGTDDKRRDIMVALFWGAPIALAFGLSAALIITFIQGLLGALGAWYGGRVDEIIDRLTDIYLVLPFLPLLVVISVVYRVTIWELLVYVIVLTIAGGLTKTTRSMAMQVATEQYIESAVAYGASKVRILLLYIMPRLVPYMLANIVLSVPLFVFLEAALSLLGLGDPALPTWGKLISDAQAGGAAVHGYWWWVLIPSSMIIAMAISFGLIGYSLDKIVNPRLRER